MSDYLVYGKKGNGKSLVCVSRMRDALIQGRRVATNLDLDLVAMFGPFSRHTNVVRLPDRPSIEDLECIGRGHDEASYDESRHGVLVLDELATWMNSRTYNDKGRAAVLDWLAHSRKKGWDTYLICQHPNQIDKQVREALVEFYVPCRKIARFKVGPITVRVPRLHVGTVKYEPQPHSLVAETWWYRGTDLFTAYDTQQVFRPNVDFGPYTMLPPWHREGYRYEKPGFMWRWFKKLPPLKLQYKLRPKRPEVQAAMRLPPAHRIRVLNAAAPPLLASAGGPA